MASETQIKAGQELRATIFNHLKRVAYEHEPCPRYDQIAAFIRRDRRTAMNYIREMHKEGKITIHNISHNRIIVEVDGMKSKASILRSDAESTNDKPEQCDTVIDEKRNFSAFLAKLNLRGLRFEDSRAACKPERPWTKRPEPRTSSGVAQYG